MGKLKVTLVYSICVLFMITLFGSGQAFGKTIRLKYGSSVSKTHTFSHSDIAWMDKIEKESNGQVKITAYWGGSLLSRRENTQELIAGVADLGYIGPRTGYPLMLGTLGFPYGLSDWRVIDRVYREVGAKFPQLEEEWSKLKIMASSVSSTYQLISTKPVRTVEDFKGLMVKATGVYTQIIKELGGDGLYVPMGETYMALQKGTIDACLAPYSTIKAFKFDEVAKYVTVLDLASSVRPSRAMNLQSWNKLPNDIKEIFEESIEFWSSEDNEWRARDDEEGIQQAKGSGVEFIELAPSELQKVYEAADKACREEAEKLDKEGLPGSAIYEETRKLVNLYGK